MARVQSWEVSDASWNRVAPLVPQRQRDPTKVYQRKPGGGRKRKEPRLVLEAIVFMSAERFGSASAIHVRFLKWEREGFFEALWKAGLTEYDELEGIAWRWQSIDGVAVKAPLPALST